MLERILDEISDPLYYIRHPEARIFRTDIGFIKIKNTKNDIILDNVHIKPFNITSLESIYPDEIDQIIELLNLNPYEKYIEKVAKMKTRVKVIVNSQFPERDINEALYNLGNVIVKDIKLYPNSTNNIFHILIIYETPTES